MLHKAFTGDSEPFVRRWLSDEGADITDPIGHYMAFPAIVITLSQYPELHSSAKSLPTKNRRDLFIIPPGESDPNVHGMKF
jgi:hypothetical protein